MGQRQPDTHPIDSLYRLYQAATDDSLRLRAGIQLIMRLERNNPTRAIELREEVEPILDRRPVSDSTWAEWTFALLNNLEHAYLNVGDNGAVLALLMEQLALAQQLGDQRREASVLANLGVQYQDQQMFPEAMAYYRQSLAIDRAIESIYGVAMCLGNIGTLCGSMQEAGLMEVDSSIHYYRRSFELMQDPRMHDQAGAMGWMLNNIGAWFEEQGQIDSAFAYYHRSLATRQSVDHLLGMIIVHRDLASLFDQVGKVAEAQAHINASIRLATDNHIAYGIDASYLLRSQLRAKAGDYRGALADHQQYVTLRDSVVSEENARQLVQQTMRYEYQKQALADSIEFAKEAQIKDLQIAEQEASLGQQRIALWGVILGLALIGALAYAIFRGKKRSDELLLNILPAETARELKAKGSAAAKEYEKVSILFSDFVGFTPLAERLSAAALVAEINVCFKAFDEIITRYGLEKIKTIGDAYMAAGGLPDPLSASPRDVALAGLEMQQFMIQRKAERAAADLPYFEMRVGIHTGPVIAGVVGIKKFQYDIWGDTVNIASRMESHGMIGEVNVSAHTCALLQDEVDLRFEARGATEVKGKGVMEMYLVQLAPDHAEAEAYLMEKLS